MTKRRQSTMTHRLQNTDHLWPKISKKIGFVVILTFIMTMMSNESYAFRNKMFFVRNVAHNGVFSQDEQIAVFETKTMLICLISCNHNGQCQSFSYNSISMTCQHFRVAFWGKPITGTQQSGWMHYDPYKSLSCKDVQEKQYQHITGIYTLYPNDLPSFSVKCEMNVDGGGWMVIQHRYDGTVNFQRTWAEYKRGFGNLRGEFWLENDRIHAITTSAVYELRVDISDWEGNNWYAVYRTFRVDNEYSKYMLTIGGYSGTAGDSMETHNRMFFSTLDVDNDISFLEHCSVYLGGSGGWWFNDCDEANLNGVHVHTQGSGFDGINWLKAKNTYESLKVTRMMISQL